MSALPALRGGSLKLIRGLAGRGVREVDIANALNVPLSDWQRLKAGNPKVMAAFEEGRSEEHLALHNSLFDAATIRGNVDAAKFLLRTRHGYDDKPQPQPEAGRVTIYNFPAALSPEQYVQLAKVTERQPVLEGAVEPVELARD